MRFFLDNDVPVSVGTMLRRHGHDAWTANNAGLAGEKEDDLLTVYAEAKQAVLVTIDIDFSQSRYGNTYGKHLWLHCAEPEAAAILQENFDEVLEYLERDHVCVRVSRDGVRAETNWQ